MSPMSPMPMKKTAAVAIPIMVLTGMLAACGDDSGTESTGSTQSAKAGEAIAVTASDNACNVATTELPTGPATFSVKNEGSQANEFYVLTKAGRVEGEVSNIEPGDTRTLIVELREPGDYVAQCKPGASNTQGTKNAETSALATTLKVSGEAVNAANSDSALAEAVSSYKDYIRAQVQDLQELGGDFVAAVNAGDIAKAKQLFPVARTPYERIEPVAEALPNDLDPRLDLREADLAEGDEWSGFHKIEKDLWNNNAITAETKKTADQLGKDIKELNTAVNSDEFTITPVQIATGAQELLDEIATSKITGEENVFAHTDLWDFQANLDGSRAAINSLETPLEQRAPGKLKEINKRFDAVQKQLDKYRQGDGFISYDKVDAKGRKDLSSALDHLTEAVAEVQGVVAQQN